MRSGAWAQDASGGSAADPLERLLGKDDRVDFSGLHQLLDDVLVFFGGEARSLARILLLRDLHLVHDEITIQRLQQPLDALSVIELTDVELLELYVGQMLVLGLCEISGVSTPKESYSRIS